MKKIFSVLVALVLVMSATAVPYWENADNLQTVKRVVASVEQVTSGAEISDTDNFIIDWNNLPPGYVVTAVRPRDAYYFGLKSVKVFADLDYINILVEPYMDELSDLSLVPFHIFINTDNSDATGGYGDLFTDANADIMMEGYIYRGVEGSGTGEPCNYEPIVAAWTGAVGGSNWAWEELSQVEPFCTTRHVNGFVEIQMLRALIPTPSNAPWNTMEFGVGFEVEQSWYAVGLLPLVSPTDYNYYGHTHKLQVPIYPQSISQHITNNMCGDSLVWDFVDGVLTISGTGDMWNYNEWSERPWHQLPIESVIVAEGATSIGKKAFGSLGMTSITIPNSVTSIGGYAFSGCSGLTSVTIGNSVTRIGDYAFSGCSGLTSVTIPNSVTSIGSRAFYGCSGLTSATIPNSLTSIGGYTFWGCSGLTSPIYNAHVFAFMPTSYSGAYTIPNGIESIIDGAFYGCSGLTNVTIPNSVTSIGESAFEFCISLTSLTIGKSVTSFGQSAFYGCSGLTSVVWNAKNCGNFIWDNTPFYYHYDDSNITIFNFDLRDQITSFTFGNDVEYIPAYLCRGMSNLTSINIPNRVTNIGSDVFSDCSGLKDITFGTNLKVIEGGAFAKCDSIETITCYSMRPPTVSYDSWSSTFPRNMPYSTIIYVPADCLNTYKMHDFWGMYDVRPIGAETTETTGIQVTSEETTATVAWPIVSGATTYELVIKDKQGNVICTLIFNSNGQLTEIAFNAPSRNGVVEQTQTAGFSFTVTGLEEGTAYDLTITSKDENGTTLDQQTIAFSTAGGTGVENVMSDDVQSTKIIRNGQILILRDGKTYTMQGQEI